MHGYVPYGGCLVAYETYFTVGTSGPRIRGDDGTGAGVLRG